MSGCTPSPAGPASMSITVPYPRAGRFHAPLILALIVLMATVLRLASPGSLIAYLAADYLDASSPASGKVSSRPSQLFDMETEQVVEGAIPDKWRPREDRYRR